MVLKPRTAFLKPRRSFRHPYRAIMTIMAKMAIWPFGHFDDYSHLGHFGPGVLACAMRSLAIVITIVQSFSLSFFLLHGMLFNHFWGNPVSSPQNNRQNGHNWPNGQTAILAIMVIIPHMGVKRSVWDSGTQSQDF